MIKQLIDIVYKLNSEILDLLPVESVFEINFDTIYNFMSLKTDGYSWYIEIFDHHLLDSEDCLYDNDGNLVDFEKVIRQKFNNLINNISKLRLKG